MNLANGLKKILFSYEKKFDNIGQSNFALILGVSIGTVRAWEQGIKGPSGPSRRPLDIIDINPEVVNQLPSACKSKVVRRSSRLFATKKATKRYTKKKQRRRAS